MLYDSVIPRAGFQTDMITIRYTDWDGSQRVQLSADKIFEELAEHLSSTDDMQKALEQLMRQGLGEEDDKLKGLDDLVRDLREEMRKRYRESNMRSSLDEMQDRLDSILNQEQRTLEERRPQQPELEEKGAVSPAVAAAPERENGEAVAL